MIEVLQYEFMRNALMAGLLVSIACGIIGALVVVNRIVFISGGIAHASYGGIGLAFFAGFSPNMGAALAALISALIMGLVSRGKKHRADTVIGVIWAVGMSTGIILIDLTPGYNVDLMSYLFGSILMVPKSSLWTMAVMNLGIFILIQLFYRDFLTMSYDEEFAVAMGVPVGALYFLLLIMVALTVVMTIQVVGLILVIALLTIPSYLAEKYTRSLKSMMLAAVLISIFFTQTGIWLSYYLNLTTGATIVMVAAAFFFLSGLVSKIPYK
ncbi:metal ABC transporter permease [Desulfonatronovibrio magnus]|uniref:metal ABC transporter permease n=1 Tax=Desulfonatronovibrio magnus TaxID=698827 RepID=UPI0005EAF07F|nr:metal ABC transporter permease [Desulfonatronovibrio magnus]